MGTEANAGTAASPDVVDLTSLVRLRRSFDMYVNPCLFFVSLRRSSCKLVIAKCQLGCVDGIDRAHSRVRVGVVAH